VAACPTATGSYRYGNSALLAAFTEIHRLASQTEPGPSSSNDNDSMAVDDGPSGSGVDTGNPAHADDGVSGDNDIPVGNNVPPSTSNVGNEVLPSEPDDPPATGKYQYICRSDKEHSTQTKTYIT
jgi:hypothetical protein